MSKCILDIGTNDMKGYETLVPILGIDDSWYKVFVEPNPENYEKIEKKLESIPNSIFYKRALCEDNEIHTLLTRDDIYGDTAATIMGLDFINTSIGSVNQAVPSYNSFEVQGITAREIISKIEQDEIYIKCDAEGIEYDFLENFPFEYKDKIKCIYVEFHAHDDAMRNRRDTIINFYKELGIPLFNWD
ncbi:FkbM family methyltransferase [Patescibacteria group bacterium]|nr:FkbM family methyltransferase [Patescibacteria group bacterium]